MYKTVIYLLFYLVLVLRILQKKGQFVLLTPFPIRLVIYLMCIVDG